MKSTLSIIAIIRPLNIGIAILSSFLTAYLISLEAAINTHRLFELCLIIICYMSGANILNDYMDIEIDKINKPHRPLLNIQFNSFLIIFIIIIFFILGSIISIQHYNLSSIIALSFVLPVIILYEIILKRMPLIGNIAISSLVGIVFIFIEAGLTNKIDITYPIMILAFNLNLIREIIKDIQDLEGDKLHNMKTLPIILGKHKTIIFVRILFIVFITLSLSPMIVSQYSKVYIPLIFFSIHLPLLYIILRMTENITSKECDTFSTYLKIMIINGILIILISS